VGFLDLGFLGVELSLQHFDLALRLISFLGRDCFSSDKGTHVAHSTHCRLQARLDLLQFGLFPRCLDL
jgi:hypothetical protein